MTGSNSHSSPALVSERALLLDPAALLRRAEAATGLNDWGTPPFDEPLERLCRSAIDDADLSTERCVGFAARIDAILQKRLSLYDDRKRHPEIAQQVIAHPLVVTGLPRSGTTILHGLLGQDPGARVAQRWEVERPSPPPRRASYDSDPRIAMCEAEVAALPAAFRAMHVMGATLPEECNSIMTMAFLSPNFGALANVSGYVDWLVDEADMAPGFAVHRHMLQHLQAFHPGGHWVLKSPPFLWWLGDLLETYPGARVIVTHRDPTEVIPSNSSLIAYLQQRDSVEGRRAVGAQQAAIWKQGVDRLRRLRQGRALSEAIIDIRYADFLADPMGAVSAIYSHAGLSLTAQAADAMRLFMAQNAQNSHGRHDYNADAFGLDSDKIRVDFADYIAEYVRAPVAAGSEPSK